MELAQLADRGAEFSPCRTWRYALWRHWGSGDRVLNVIGLNPSVADEMLDDPTIRRCTRFARDWGYDGLWMTNLFAFRSTDPKGLTRTADPVGPRNDHTLWTVARMSGLVLAAWGVHGALQHRGLHVKQALAADGIDVRAFGFTKDGYPKHPLYLAASTQPVPWVTMPT